MGFPVDGAPRRGPALRRTPRGLLIPACIGLAFVAIPVGALAVRVPWSNLGGAAGDASLGTALRLSLLSGVAATALALTLGVPLGWLLARGTFRGRSLVRVAALLPLALPPVVGGLALLMAFGRRGVLGAPLEDLGIVLPFTLTATILAQTFVALPFVVLAVEAAVGAVPGEPEEVAASLGAGPMAVFWRVTLPLARPGVVAGAALAFARAGGIRRHDHLRGERSWSDADAALGRVRRPPAGPRRGGPAVTRSPRRVRPVHLQLARVLSRPVGPRRRWFAWCLTPTSSLGAGA